MTLTWGRVPVRIPTLGDPRARKRHRLRYRMEHGWRSRPRQLRRTSAPQTIHAAAVTATAERSG